MTLTYQGEASLEFRVRYESDNPEEQLCLYDLDCRHESKVAWNTSLTTVAGTLNLTVQQSFDSIIEYECGIARGFNVSGWPETEYLPARISMRCNDVSQWIYEQPENNNDLLDTVYVEDDFPVCKCKFADTACLVGCQLHRLISHYLQGPTASILPFPSPGATWSCTPPSIRTA